MVTGVRGFSANEETKQILESYDIPKMGFSKFMNEVVKDWHTSKINGDKKDTEIKSITDLELHV